VADADPSPDEVRLALDRLGLTEGVTFDAVRAAYRRSLRIHHPDIAGADASAHAATAHLIEAYQVLVAFVEHHEADTITLTNERTSAEVSPPPREHAAEIPYDVIDAQALDEDTIAVAAPAPETYAALFEAASRIGEISYYDRQLGILETIVRFEGGPTCSVLLTLQGRAHYTEVFCTMDSIEAAPTPPIRPVLDALVQELERR